MPLIEVIDRLCSVVQAQAQIIRRYTEIIEQQNIYDSVSDDLRFLCDEVEKELDLLEKEVGSTQITS